MSMTQMVFLREANIPTNRKIEESIQRLGYDFNMLSDLEKQIGQEGLECSINGHKTYFETYVDVVNNAITENEADWIKPDLTNQDIAISFVWGADLAAGGCIELISIALTDLTNALVYYMDTRTKYTREMLLSDASLLLDELNKSSNGNGNHPKVVKSSLTNPQKKNTFWGKLKNIFK